MRCQGYKSGVGTLSRVETDAGFTVGVLAVPNFGFPGDLVIAGVPFGKELATLGQPSERVSGPASTQECEDSGQNTKRKALEQLNDVIVSFH